MADIYRRSLDAKYQALLQVMGNELSLGDDLTALTADELETVQYAVDHAIMAWAMRRRESGPGSRPDTNLQHLLDEYCAIADHL